MLFKGSGVALVTPFKNGRVDYRAIEELINFQIEHKTDAIIMCGTTGEASTLSFEEKEKVVRFAKEVIKNRVPLIAGVGGNNTQEVINLTKKMEDIEVDGLLSVTPYYNRTTQKGLIAHYEAIANETKLPIILYNVPARTGVNMLPDTVYTLSKHPKIVGIKEASGDIAQVAKIASLVDSDFAIYSGNDDMIVPLLSLGGVGVISVLANVCPKETHDLVTLYLEGKITEAKDLQLHLLGLINALFIENNPIPVKEALNLIGLPAGEYRLPLVEMNEKNKLILKEELVKVGFSIKE